MRPRIDWILNITVPGSFKQTAFIFEINHLIDNVVFFKQRYLEIVN